MDTAVGAQRYIQNQIAPIMLQRAAQFNTLHNMQTQHCYWWMYSPICHLFRSALGSTLLDIFLGLLSHFGHSTLLLCPTITSPFVTLRSSKFSVTLTEGGSAITAWTKQDDYIDFIEEVHKLKPPLRIH